VAFAVLGAHVEVSVHVAGEEAHELVVLGHQAELLGRLQVRFGDALRLQRRGRREGKGMR